MQTIHVVTRAASRPGVVALAYTIDHPNGSVKPLSGLVEHVTAPLAGSLSRVEGALLGISEALRAADPAVPTLLRIVSTGAYATLEASDWKPTANAPIGLLEARAALLEAVGAFSDLRVELLSQQDETIAPLMQAAKEEAEIAAAERIAAIGLAA